MSMIGILKQALLVLLLIGAGMVSPSNGVDDIVEREPLQMLAETLVIIAASLVAYISFRWAREGWASRGLRYRITQDQNL